MPPPTPPPEVIPSSPPPVEEQPKEPFLSPDLMLVGIAALVAIVLLTGTLVYLKGKRPAMRPDTMSTMTSYIRRYRESGYSDNQIAAQLRRYHSEKEVLAAFESLDLPRIIGYIGKHRAQGFADSQIKGQLEQYFPLEEIDDAFKRAK